MTDKEQYKNDCLMTPFESLKFFFSKTYVSVDVTENYCVEIKHKKFKGKLLIVSIKTTKTGD